MSSINLNSSSLLLAQRVLQVNSFNQANSLHKLATGLRINTGKDDPAGLITSENLRSMLKALEAETRAAQRAEDVISVADGALGEVSSLLHDAQSLVVRNANTAGLSAAEREANQMELNSILSTVDRLSGSTTFNGEKLLNGDLSITVNDQTIDIDSVSTGSLGATTVGADTHTLNALRQGGGLNIVDGDLGVAQQVLEQAQTDIATQRGELGAFSKYNLGSRISSLQVSIENIAAANSRIRDTDYGSETAELARLNVLVQSSLQAVRFAGARQVSVLNLLV